MAVSCNTRKWKPAVFSTLWKIQNPEDGNQGASVARLWCVMISILEGYPLTHSQTSLLLFYGCWEKTQNFCISSVTAQPTAWASCFHPPPLSLRYPEVVQQGAVCSVCLCPARTQCALKLTASSLAAGQPHCCSQEGGATSSNPCGPRADSILLSPHAFGVSKMVRPTQGRSPLLDGLGGVGSML